MDWSLFLIFLAACCAAGATGSLFPPGPWYFTELRKPSWTPPSWLFPVAWTALYLASAYGATRVAMLDGNGSAMAFWALQIALNTLWSPVFFGLRRLGTALVVLIFLWVAVLGTMTSFWAADWVAGLLLAPYLVWVSYASALNFWIWRHNQS